MRNRLNDLLLYLMVVITIAVLRMDKQNLWGKPWLLDLIGIHKYVMYLIPLLIQIIKQSSKYSSTVTVFGTSVQILRSEPRLSDSCSPYWCKLWICESPVVQTNRATQIQYTLSIYAERNEFLMDVFFRFSLYVVRHPPLSQKWIHTYCWLIEDQELRVVHQSNREGYSTLLATAVIRKQFRR